MLSKINHHPFDNNVFFVPDGHKYYINNDNTDVISCTSFISKFFGNFNSDDVINDIVINQQNPKYFNMTKDEIKNLWETENKLAQDLGTQLHSKIEDFYNLPDNLKKSFKTDDKDFSFFLNFFNDFKTLKIFRTEWIIYYDILKIAGAIDCVFINDDGSLSIYDWKRTKNIHLSGFNNAMATYPFLHMPDCNFSKYSLQLNLYRIILEKFYNFKVKEMFLVSLHPSQDNYKLFKVNRLDKEANWLLDMRMKDLQDIGYNINISLDFTVKNDIRMLDRFKFKKNDTFKDISLSNYNMRNYGLSDKQQQAFDIICKGKNIFITGPGGCGKTHLIKHIYNHFNLRKNIAITSTTGTSAILIDGSTLHSYLGIGLGNDDAGSLYMKIKKNTKIRRRWEELDILVIDEVSMLSPTLFDKLEQIARVIRRSECPFGGIQIILSGDFYQLPVVGETDAFCFDAKSWKSCIKNIVYLTENFRQSDPIFLKCLNEIRVGNISDETYNILKSRVNVPLHNELGIKPTKIYSLNRDVDIDNENELDKLVLENENLEFYEYKLEYQVFKDNIHNVEEKISKKCVAPYNLQLCIGAQVMLLYNIDLENKLVNGSRGVITRFVENFPEVLFLNGVKQIITEQTWEIYDGKELIISCTQVPLRIAYSITSHKSQGLTIDYAIVDLDNIFENGQAYVALSRVRSLEGLSIRNLKKIKVKAHPKVIEFYSKLD